jgi:DNA polymerase III sliding clamp (beta) subunit (PCNA family)
MLETLKLVRGAVASKDLIPVLTHFHISGGRIQGGNSRLAIDAACPELAGHSIVVPADKFLRAVDACKGEPTITVTDTKVEIKKGRFKAHVHSVPPETYPHLDVDFSEVRTPAGPLLPALRAVREFISTDASRPWSNAVLFHEGWAYATDNVTMVRTPVAWEGRMALPGYAVDELLRIGREPQRIHQGEHGVGFDYGTFWLRTTLIDGSWPDVWRMFEHDFLALPALPDGLLEAVETVAPFCADSKVPVILFQDGAVTTMEGAHGAAVDGFTLPDGAFRSEVLRTVLAVATHADLSLYPKAIPFRGANLEGLFVGMRK